MIVATNVAFGEGPRWHEGALWWSDMHGNRVNRLVDGVVEAVCEVPMQPSGLGWLPDGRLLVVSMTALPVHRHVVAAPTSAISASSLTAPRRRGRPC